MEVDEDDTRDEQLRVVWELERGSVAHDQHVLPELPVCPVARICASLRIPGGAGPYRGIRANMEQT
jgi:hypothetical protein